MFTDIENELERIRKSMEQTDPSSEKYGTLMGRYKALAAILLSAQKSERETVQQANDIEHKRKEMEMRERKEAADIEFRNKELEWKIQKDADEYNARVIDENNKVAMDQRRIDLEYDKLDAEHERIEVEKMKARNDTIKIGNDNVTTLIESATDIFVTAMKNAGQVYVSYMGIKGMICIAKGILSDEEAGKLHYGKLFSLLKTPNPFSFKF